MGMNEVLYPLLLTAMRPDCCGTVAGGSPPIRAALGSETKHYVLVSSHEHKQDCWCHDLVRVWYACTLWVQLQVGLYASSRARPHLPLINGFTRSTPARAAHRGTASSDVGHHEQDRAATGGMGVVAPLHNWWTAPTREWTSISGRLALSLLGHGFGRRWLHGR